jgi:nicotinamidase/pyrazinamidase
VARNSRRIMSRAGVKGPEALLVVDMQRDFMPGGALAVPEADALVPRINHYIDHFTAVGTPIYLSRDWHPPDHCSFREQGGRWPPHCIAGTPGAEFARGLRVPESAVVVSKAATSTEDAYSAFERTSLATLLQSRGVRHLWVAGVATDYCVRASVLDARRLGLHVTLLVDAIRGVDVQAGDADRALAEMVAAGADAHSWARSRTALAAP